MLKHKRFIITATLIILVILLVVGFIFLKRNTELFNSPSETDIVKNNDSSPVSTNNPTDLNTLIKKEVKVPDQFKQGLFSRDRRLSLPEDFEISVYEVNLSGPRHMDFTSEGTLIVTDKKAGQIILLPDQNNDQVSDGPITVIDGLRNVHGLDYYNGDLYYAEEDRISVLRNLKEDGSYSSQKLLIDNLPSGDGLTTIAGHVTRTVKIGPDEKIYFTVGSSCNICEEKDEHRAAMLVADLDGSNLEIYATGLRNTVDFTFVKNGDKFEIYGVDNGRDRIGDNIPPEEVNLISQGSDYGWPYCYGDQIANPEFDEKQAYCEKSTELPFLNMQAHSAPLGIINIDSQNLPTELQDNFLITFHGSWNRTTPTGYKVVRVDHTSGDPTISNFITGWLNKDGTKWGRPVGIVASTDGDLYISDDAEGVIYLVRYLPDKS